jgi:predicted nucleotide-binding protein
MSRRPQVDDTEIRQFTISDINRGIAKLRRRVDEVRSLTDHAIEFDDTRVDNVEASVREAIREVFGQRSPEFKDHQYHRIWRGGLNMGDSRSTRQAKYQAGVPQTVTMIEGLISRLEEKKLDVEGEQPQRPTLEDTTIDQERKHNVLVVYGRNESLRRAMFDFLRAIALNPMEWDELVGSTNSAAPYVGQVLDSGFAKAQAVVVMLTPDDLACLREELRSDDEAPHETQLSYQARPNVLFEAGMALARHPNRTILVEIGKLRPFSDIAGRHTIRFRDDVASRQRLAQRLLDAQCSVRTNDRTDWQTAGNFEAMDAIR